MPKALNRDHLHYLSPEEWRTLTAIEMGMKNHSIVPLEIVLKISNCKRGSGGIIDIIKNKLIPAKLVAYEISQIHNYKGYRLTNSGYDYLAIHALIKSGHLSQIGSVIGAGKESDIYLCVAGENVGQLNENDENLVVVKFHRLGRISFRTVKNKREYTKNSHKCSWLYLDRLAAHREYQTIQKLYESGIPVPRPIANNRNAVVMEYIDRSILLSQILPETFTANDCELAHHLYGLGKNILHEVVSKGLIHGDFNEFNLLVLNISENLESDFEPSKTRLVLIDFPQILSRDHCQAQEIYSRDRSGLIDFFSRFIDIEEFPMSKVDEIKRSDYLDIQLKAPGYKKIRQENRIIIESESEEDNELEEHFDKLAVGGVKKECPKASQDPIKSSFTELTKEEVKKRKEKEHKKKFDNNSCKNLKKQIRTANKRSFKKENLALFEL